MTTPRKIIALTALIAVILFMESCAFVTSRFARRTATPAPTATLAADTAAPEPTLTPESSTATAALPSATPPVTLDPNIDPIELSWDVLIDHLTAGVLLSSQIT